MSTSAQSSFDKSVVEQNSKLYAPGPDGTSIKCIVCNMIVEKPNPLLTGGNDKCDCDTSFADLLTASADVNGKVQAYLALTMRKPDPLDYIKIGKNIRDKGGIFGADEETALREAVAMLHDDAKPKLMIKIGEAFKADNVKVYIDQLVTASADDTAKFVKKGYACAP